MTVTPPTSDPNTVQHYPIPAGRIGLVVGKAGSGLRRIGEEAGVKVELPRPPPGQKHEGDVHMQLTGTPENIQHAIQLIVKVLETPSRVCAPTAY